MMARPDFSLEAALGGRVAGVDEAGRGPLAGPVLAAALVFLVPPPESLAALLQDSKKLKEAARDAAFAALQEAQAQGLVEIGVGAASASEIGRLNILRASHLAMERAVAGLALAPDHILIDGNMIPRGLAVSAEAIVKGDARSLSIAAASIVAKVCRDRLMVDLAQQHPGYGWENNAGYPSPAHKEALRNLGVTPHHRRSFKPVHNILYQE